MFRLICGIIVFTFLSCSDTDEELDCTPFAIYSQRKLPALGWNSYDSYQTTINESLMLAELASFKKRLKPKGYNYFVLDNGWANDDFGVSIDSFGRNIPDPRLFPNGMKSFIDKAHSMGIKVGLWMVRGISRKAVIENMPIYGTNFFAQDIADVNDTCDWCWHNYGVDMSKAGSQEYYDSKIALMASWGIDFIKFDDAAIHPDEIYALHKAIKKSGRDIYLSISPGGELRPDLVPWYKYADCLRITYDMWDDSQHVQNGFSRWEKMQSYSNGGFALDLDMLPMGLLMRDNQRRHDFLTVNQKKTMLTQRALAASPLVFGGSCIGSDEQTVELVTNSHMLECNQNNNCGKLIYREGVIDVWGTYMVNNTTSGWVGVFNRSDSLKTISFTRKQLGLNQNAYYKIYDIWNDSKLPNTDVFTFTLGSDEVIFLKYESI